MKLRQDRFIDKAAVFFSIFGVLALNTGITIIENGYAYVIIMILSFALAVLRLMTKRNRPKNTMLIMQILFLFFCFFSTQWAYSRTAAMAAVKSIFLTTVIIFTFSALLDDERMMRFFCKAFVYAQIVTLLYFTYRFGALFLINLRADEASKSGVLNANSVGMSLMYSSFISWTYSKIAEEKKVLYVVLAVFFAVLGFLTASKKVMFLAVILYLGYYLLRTKRPFAFLGKLFIGLCAVYAVYYIVMNTEFFYEIIGYRMEEVFDLVLGNEVDEYSSTGQRLQLLEIGKKLIADKPWLGWGIANAAELNVYDTYLHNNYYELASGIGIVGAIVYYLRYLQIFNFFKTIRRQNNFLPILFFLIMLSLLLMDYALVSYNSRYIQVLLCGCISYMAIVRRNEEMHSKAGMD